jgi:hypothetical protein
VADAAANGPCQARGAARLAAARFSMPLRPTRTAEVVAPRRCRAGHNICARLLVNMMSVPEVELYLNHWAISILPGPYRQWPVLYVVEGHRFCMLRRGRRVQQFHTAWLAPGDIPRIAARRAISTATDKGRQTA